MTIETSEALMSVTGVEATAAESILITEAESLDEIRRETVFHLPENGNNPENAFTHFMLDFLQGRGALDNVERFYMRKDTPPIKINGWGFADDGRKTVFIITTVYMNSPTPTRLPPELRQEAIRMAMKYIDFVMNGGSSQLLDQEQDTAQRVHDLVKKAAEVRFFVLTDGIVDRVTDHDPARMIGNINVNVELWGLGQYTDLQNGLEPQDIDVVMADYVGHDLPCLAMPEVGDNSVYSAILPGKLLSDLYAKYARRLLETNVRQFLTTKTATNKEIRNTLKAEPERFMEYNNGIVATATEAFIRRDGMATYITRLKGLQIVNGGQTTASISVAEQDEKVDLSKVFVNAKIVVIPRDKAKDHVGKISRSANTQNGIKAADFGSNDPFHVDLQKLSRKIHAPDGRCWYYERSSGEFNVELMQLKKKGGAAFRSFAEQYPRERVFSKLDLASFLSTWDGRPHEVSKGGQTNFQAWRKRQAIEGQVLDATFFKRTIAKGIILKSIKKMIEREKDRFPAYRANIAYYLSSFLAHSSSEVLDLDAIWRNQRLSDELMSALNAASKPVLDTIRDIAGDSNVTQACKQAALWESFKDSGLQIHLEGVPEIIIPHVESSSA